MIYISRHALNAERIVPKNWVVTTMNPHGRVAFLPLVRVRIKCKKPNDIPQNPKTLGEHIKKRRLTLGLTQRLAAHVLGVNPGTVLNWETGRFEPRIRWLPAILGFLGYDPFPQPTSLGEQLLHVRRQHGWSSGKRRLASSALTARLGRTGSGGN
jgi:DNA-binding XRE family transcriptional regulator